LAGRRRVLCSGAFREATWRPALSSRELVTSKRNRRPSGRNHGQKWPVSSREASCVVRGFASPPAAGTEKRLALVPPLAKMIVPSAFQAPPRKPTAGSAQTRCTVSPARLSFFSSAPARAQHRPDDVGLCHTQRDGLWARDNPAVN